MTALWIELSVALLGAAAIGFWTGWRVRGADVRRADAEAKRMRALWLQLAEAEAEAEEEAAALALRVVPADKANTPTRRAAG